MGAVGATGARRSWSVGANREFSRSHDGAYWIFLLLVAGASLLLAWSLLLGARASPATLLHAAAWAAWGGVAYAVVTRADLNWSVPGQVRLAAVAWGVSSVMYARPLVTMGQDLLPVTERWSAAVHAPLPQEAVKLVGVVLIALVVPAVFSRPLGALVVGMLTGLGFTIAENLERTNVAAATGRDWSLPGELLRLGVSGSPWAHPLCTGVAALAVWCVVASRGRRPASRAVGAVAFVGLALFLRFLQEGIEPALGPGELAVAFRVLELALLAGLVLWARRADRQWFRTLAHGGLPPVIDLDEAEHLSTRRGRRRARRAGAAREVQKTQLRYANAVADGDDSTAEDLLHRERLLRIGGHGQRSF